MNTRAAYSVPANLLIAGEYAITHPGGRGLSVAIEPRARATVLGRAARPDEARFRGWLAAGDFTGGELRITAIGPAPDAVAWPEGEVGLVLPALAHVARWFREQTMATAPRRRCQRRPLWEVILDTRAFHDPRTGRKTGAGSSAAAAALLVAALLRLGGVRPERDPDSVVALAIGAHRDLNDGRGSGYDIATSVLGGTLLFSGGSSPSWERVSVDRRWRDHELALYSWHQGRPVSSSLAVKQFERFVPPESPERSAYIAQSNAAVQAIIDGTRWCEWHEGLTRARAHGEAIGAMIGVSAELPFGVAHCDDGWVAKASGAGNERVVLVSTPAPRRPIPPHAVEVAPAAEGLRLESTP